MTLQYLGEVWRTRMGKEFGQMAQGDKKAGTVGTNTIFVMIHDEIDCIPEDRVLTYVRIVIGFCLQKEDPSRVCITAGCNLIRTPGDLTTRTAELTTSKILWNSILSGRRNFCRIRHLEFLPWNRYGTF